MVQKRNRLNRPHHLLLLLLLFLHFRSTYVIKSKGGKSCFFDFLENERVLEARILAFNLDQFNLIFHIWPR